jgi:monovalent cation:proton antiporter-2 (CPA2) family protein
MHGESFFFQAFVYLTAAVISVPVAKRLGLGSVLGYLIAGFIIGPFGLNFIGEEGQDVMHFAEFGVVMMLFLIGLELQPSRLWRLRGPILGMGGLQVLITTSAITALGLVMGFPFKGSLAVGMILSLSSTALVLQTLREKGLWRTNAGQSSFSVLLFQDIVVIPMLAAMPLLAVNADEAVEDVHAAYAMTWVEGLPGWGQTLVVLGVMAFIILAGLFLVRPIFRAVAETRLRELFTAAALLLVIGTALLMSKVGLSPALGTFLAGVVLANSEYRHELEGNIEPFKGLLLGLFFIAVGASIDFKVITSDPAHIGAIVCGLIIVKLSILLVLGRFFKMGTDQNILFACSLAQGGEFAFVLSSFAVQHHVIGNEVANSLISAVAVSMAVTPLLLIVNEKLLQPRFGTVQKETREADSIDEESPAIIVGFGEFGSVIGRILRANGVGITVLDHDSDKVELMRKLGLKVFYGDASRHDLLNAAGADKAKIIILALDDHDKMLKIIHMVKKEFSNLHILARAMDRTRAYELIDAGADHVYRQTLDTSLRASVDALRKLGFRSHHVNRVTKTFRHHDEESFRDLRHVRHDKKAYISHARQRIADLEQYLLSELYSDDENPDAGWDITSMLEEFGKKEKKKD